MSSSDRVNRRRLLAALVVLPLLAGCSFTPLYGEGAVSAGAGFAYAEPTTRLEQLIYQELAFRLGTDAGPNAPLVTVSAVEVSQRVGRTAPSAVMTAYELTVTAHLLVTRTDALGHPVFDAADKPLLDVTRFASSSYEISGQVAADRAAAQSAREQAARAVADTLRLILAAARNKGDI